MTPVVLVFAAVTVPTVVVGLLLVRVHRQLPSLRWTVLVVAVSAVAAAAGVVAASAAAMFLSAHDLELVYAALVFGVALGVLFALAVAGPLTRDLRVVAAAAGSVADGDLTVRTGIDRRDEVGALAKDVDAMVERLRELQSQRDRDESARRHLLAAISHDLRTPLATLRVAVESLQDGVATDEHRYLSSMADDVELLTGMVDDLFLIARMDAGKMELERMPVDLAELADSAAESMAPLARQREVSLEVNGDAALRTTADARALTRVLRNLLDNAVRHAPNGSTVRVELRDGSPQTVRVLDDGDGFSVQFLAAAFEAFSRADSARTRDAGAGLGLAIAKGIVEAHGGTIWAEPGPGGAVAFALPAQSS
jgi:two-component system, OmpR family, sensor histidine kinase BaeS